MRSSVRVALERQQILRRNKMGRPINNRYIGNTSGSGQTIQATAYFTGLGGTANAWISAQKATNTYNMVSATGLYSDRVELTNGGVALQPGQANITVQPYGYTGSGATAIANLGVTGYTVTSGGTGTSAAGYIPGQILSVNGGTYNTNQRANAKVTSVTLGAVGNITTNTGYTVGDKFTWNYAGWLSPTVITVATTTGNGNISGVTITSAGTTTSTSISNTTVYSSATTANAWANTANFNLRWDVSGLATYNQGDYTTPPANPISFTPASGNGTGAAATASYGISSTRITNGGSGYQAVNVVVSGVGGAIVTDSLANGSVTALSVVAPGTFGPTRPTLTISPIASLEYAEVIRNLTVTTWSYNTYEWVPTGTVPQEGQAVLQTA